MNRADSMNQECSSYSPNSLNIIEGDDEQDSNAEAFADMAMSNMNMNMELHSKPIETLLDSSEIQERRENRTPSAYEVLRNGTVHYSRREDKLRALEKHPSGGICGS
ncbi:unnamed protein product [Peronospora belbahrii]|uniref:Uncharacterized protein n=1 Tax=Peronospora belbahrii TaxID=622444 RepID=A0ABN8CUI8_9STRA|nr:unnamed protein product [Peronospora belbahrii]